MSDALFNLVNKLRSTEVRVWKYKAADVSVLQIIFLNNTGL